MRALSLPFAEPTKPLTPAPRPSNKYKNTHTPNDTSNHTVQRHRHPTALFNSPSHSVLHIREREGGKEGGLVASVTRYQQVTRTQTHNRMEGCRAAAFNQPGWRARRPLVVWKKVVLFVWVINNETKLSRTRTQTHTPLFGLTELTFCGL